MDLNPQLYEAKVMHKRLLPRINQFTYRVYYLALPLKALAGVGGLLPLNRRGAISFHLRDHGAHDGSDLHGWAMALLSRYGLEQTVDEIMLIAMPRVLGYVFNPVSFWLCLDKDRGLRAVIAEVNNTFGETHSYLCAHPDGRVIAPAETLSTDKCFHVSPFLPREGRYEFRFAVGSESLGIAINHFNATGECDLLTTLSGKLHPLTKAALREAMWRYPLVTLKTIGLIHWQALRLALKGVRYLRKPPQLSPTLTATHALAAKQEHLP